MRGSAAFDDLADYRQFIAEVTSRGNRRNAARIDAERTSLRPLPERRTADYEEAIVTVTSWGGLALKKVFYTVPSRLISAASARCSSTRGFRQKIPFHQ
jgi:hypothetical protein